MTLEGPLEIQADCGVLAAGVRPRLGVLHCL